MAGLAETVGGFLMALGLLTPVATALVFSVMFVAVATVHIKKGFFVQNGGYEYNLVLAISALTVTFTGPGSLSLDAFLGHCWSGTLRCVAALLAGVIGGVVSLSQPSTNPVVQEMSM